MNICLLNDSFPPLTDGVAHTVLNYGRVISERYGKAIVAVPYYPGVKDEGYPYEVVRYSSLNTTKMVGYRAGNPLDVRSLERLAAFKPDIIHTHCPIASTFVGRELREMTHAPLVFTYHTKFDYDIRRVIKLKLLQEPMIRAIIANIATCDDVWVVSEGAGENLKALGYEGEVHLMKNGVDYPNEPAPEEDVRALKTAWNIDGTCPVFLFVGRMLWYKGQKYIFDALAKLKSAGKDFRMVFIGDGEDSEEMKAYAALNGIENECIFTGKVLDRAVLRAWYTLADLFLLPSVFDNNPIVVKEAAACGTASVLIDGSSSAEGVTAGESGLLMKEDADSLYTELLRLYDDPTLAARLGKGASDALYCSWEDSIARAVKRYEEILAARKDVPKRPVHDVSAGMVDALRSLFNHD